MAPVAVVLLCEAALVLKFLGRPSHRCLLEGFSSLLQAVGRAWVGRKFPWLGELESFTSPPGELSRKEGELESYTSPPGEVE